MVLEVVGAISLAGLGFIAGFVKEYCRMKDKNEHDLKEERKYTRKYQNICNEQNKFINEVKEALYDMTLTQNEAVIKMKKLFINKFGNNDK